MVFVSGLFFRCQESNNSNSLSVNFKVTACDFFYMLHKHFLCSYDYLKIVNEKNQSFGVYCGEMSGRSVGVTGEYAVITFHSDGYVQRRGFRISFTTGSSGKKRFKKDIKTSKTEN